MKASATVMTRQKAIELSLWYRDQVKRRLDWWTTHPILDPEAASGPTPDIFRLMLDAAVDASFIRSPLGFSFEQRSGFIPGKTLADRSKDLILPQLPDVRATFTQRNRIRGGPE